MKTCPQCESKTFDDMEMCYDCMSTFAVPLKEDGAASHQAAARLQVVLAGYFNYEMLLNKMDGRALSVGSAEENAVVLPLKQVAAHQLELFYAHGQIWVESVDTSLLTTVGEVPLDGTVCINPGTEIAVGDATIILLED